MARYFFHIVDGVRTQDHEGEEHAGPETVKASAIRHARSIMADEIWFGRLPLDENIEICDDAGQLIMVVRFRDAVELPPGI